MILKGSQRGGSRQLAAHLLNGMDNDHVTLQELRGFVADDLHGALGEAHAISKATQCKQFLFSLSLNPPKNKTCPVDAFMEAVERAEKSLGLDQQPRAVVVHEKEGRRHAHVVWSRIDADKMKAVHLPFFKRKLNNLAKELYLEHGWELPDGLRENGWKNPLNFTLAEWQQAKRIGLDPREIKQQFLDAWRYSDGSKAFKSALEDRGYYLAQGDRRGFVAVDLHGEVYSIARMVSVKAKELESRLGPPSGLSSVEEVRAGIAQRMSNTLRGHVRDFSRDQRAFLQPVTEEQERMVGTHRSERVRLKEAQARRWEEESRLRQQRARKGLGYLWDVVTGKSSRTRQVNEREVFELYRRDVKQREALFEAQMEERKDLQQRLDAIRTRQRHERMRLAEHVAKLLKAKEQARSVNQAVPPKARRERGYDLER